MTTDEIAVLESNCCWAEDWQRVTVAVEGWAPKFYHRVMFYGDIRLGKVEKNIRSSKELCLMKNKMKYLYSIIFQGKYQYMI